MISRINFAILSKQKTACGYNVDYFYFAINRISQTLLLTIHRKETVSMKKFYRIMAMTLAVVFALSINLDVSAKINLSDDECNVSVNNEDEVVLTDTDITETKTQNTSDMSGNTTYSDSEALNYAQESNDIEETMTIEQSDKHTNDFLSDSNLSNPHKVALMEDKSDKIIAQMNENLSNPSDIEKALYLHDWIINHMMYNSDKGSESEGAYSCIIKGEGVCNDYSDAYYYILSKANLNCGFIESNDMKHSWNLVSVNNKSYYIDCTWDDRENDGYIDPVILKTLRRKHFLNSRNKTHEDHNSTDWILHTGRNTIDAYNSIETSNEYDNYDWSSYNYTFDDSIFNENYPQGTNELEINGYVAVATYDDIYLIRKNAQTITVLGLQNLGAIASTHLSDSESSTRYIHDISANGTTVTYHTWLKENGDASTQETHTINWSEYFSGSCGNTTWSYLNGALTISGSGSMDDYYASQSCPWEDFEDLITEVHIGKDITNITYLPVYEENLTDIYYEGSVSQWNDRLRYKSSPLFDSKAIHFGSYDVVFHSKDGNVISTQTVAEGEKAAEINAPVISNLTFKAWCTDETLKNEFDFDTLIERDYSLYPKYVKASVTVAFNSNGGSEVGSITVPGESIIEEPEAPTKENFTFVGWFSDEALTKRFDFSTPVLDDITLFAKWAEAEGTATVTFIINGNDTYKTETVAVGDCVTKPVNPVKKNYYFVGWFTEPGYKNLYNFESPVSENTSLYGQFAESIFVFFNPNNGENTYSVVTGKGCTVDKPEDPVRSGYTFDGWYTDNNTFKKKFNFSTKLTASATYLYGNWTKGSSPTPPSPTPKEPKVIKTPIAVGQKINVSNTAYMGKTYANYEVSDKKIATIDKKGNLAAKKAGTVIVYGLVKPAKKWVHDPDDGGIKITIESVTVAKANKTITATKTGKTIDVSKCFEAINIKPTSYSSSNTKVATVDNNGIVTTLAKGSSTITACYGEGKSAAKYKLTVKTVIPSISKKTVNAVTGQTFKLSVKNVPKSEPVTWSSSNDAVAIVDQSGKVTVLTYNERVTITATVDEIDYSCVITVKEPAFSKAKVTIKSGKTTKLSVKNTKYKIPDCTEWKSSDEDIATVENGVVKGISGGEVTISCMLGGVEIRTTVKVNGPISSKVPIETD